MTESGILKIYENSRKIVKSNFYPRRISRRARRLMSPSRLTIELAVSIAEMIYKLQDDFEKMPSQTFSESKNA